MSHNIIFKMANTNYMQDIDIGENYVDDLMDEQAVVGPYRPSIIVMKTK